MEESNYSKNNNPMDLENPQDLLITGRVEGVNSPSLLLNTTGDVNF